MNTETNPLFLIGQNSRGQWIAQKQSGQSGGFFVSHAAALKYALLENGHRREAVITVPGVFELDLTEHSFPVIHFAQKAAAAEQRPGVASYPLSQPAIPRAA